MDPKVLLTLKFAIFSILVAAVWLVFSILIVIYHFPQGEFDVSVDQFGMLNLLPTDRNCSHEVSIAARLCALGLTNQSTIEFDMFSHLSSGLPLNCSKGFSLFPLNNETSVCIPVCGEWEEFTPETVRGFDVALTFLFCIHMVGTIIALILCCFNYKIMFKFPSVLLVYYISIPIILDLTHFTGLTGRHSLFCRSISLFDDPTPFCSLTGVVYHFVYTSISIVWIFLTLMVFWKVWFPIHARRSERTQWYKMIHIAIVITAVVGPTVPIVSALTTGGYTVTNFPPIFACFASNPAAAFYPFIMVFCIVFPTGLTLILLTIWKLIALANYQKKGCRISCSHNSTAEIKLLTIFVYFSVVVALSFILYTIGLYRADEYQQAFDQYFKCEAFGYSSQNPCVLQVDRISYIALNIASYGNFAFSPYVTFIYIIPFEKVKNKLRSLS